jgi:hypothetical protein
MRLGVYFVFTKDKDTFSSQLDSNQDQAWNFKFDSASFSESNGDIVMLYSQSNKSHQFSFQFNLSCMNNIVEFESLFLGLD